MIEPRPSIGWSSFPGPSTFASFQIVGGPNAQEDGKNLDPEQVRKLACMWLTCNARASFAGWNPQPSAVGPVPHQPGFLIT